MYTDEQKKIIKEYNNSVDETVRLFVEGIMSGRNTAKYIVVAILSENTSKKITDLTGKKVDGNKVVLDVNAVKHIINRHGENGAQDQTMMDPEDIARMGYVISNCDLIEYAGISSYGYLDENGKPSPMIRLSKRIDGTYYVVEAVNSSKRKVNYVVTAFIQKKQSSDP